MSAVRASSACVSAVAAALVAAGCAGAKPRPAARNAPDRTAFEVPGHGGLEIAIPPGWTAETQTAEPPAPTRIRLTAPGGAFVAVVAPFWNPGEPEEASARVDNARLLAEIARRGVLGGSVESEIPLQELVGDGVRGFWFAATDRDLTSRQAGEGEWRHLLQGVAAVGPLVVVFDLLDDAPGPQREALLGIIRGARHLAAAQAADGGAGHDSDADGGERPEPDPDAATVPLRVEVRGKPWSVLVDLPGFRMFKPRSSSEGVEALVVGHDPDRGMVASVIVRPAESALDAAACREADLGKVRAAHATLADLRLGEVGEVARASYVMPELGGKPIPQLHGHAWLYRDGVCANVHLSKAAPEPDDAGVLERILASVRYGTEL